MSDIETILIDLDIALEPSLEGTLAALAIATAAFVYGRQIGPGDKQLRETGQRFLLAFVFLMAALVADLGLFPILEKFVTSTTDLDLEQNFTAILIDSSSEYVLFGAGVFWLYLGAVSLANAFGLAILKPWDWPWSSEGDERPDSSSSIQVAVLKALWDAEVGSASVEGVHRIVGGAKLKDFRKVISRLHKEGYVKENNEGDEAIYELTIAGRNQVGSTDQLA